MTMMALAGNSIQLVPDGTLLVHLVVLVIMVGLLNMTLLKPINRILEERERRTKGRLSESQRVLVTVGEKWREYEDQMREARSRGYALLENDRLASTRERERKIADVKAEVALWLDEQKRALQVDQEQVRATLEQDAGVRAMDISRQILGRPLGR